jgi:hypothetical protein
MPVIGAGPFSVDDESNYVVGHSTDKGVISEVVAPHASGSATGTGIGNGTHRRHRHDRLPVNVSLSASGVSLVGSSRWVTSYEPEEC